MREFTARSTDRGVVHGCAYENEQDGNRRLVCLILSRGRGSVVKHLKAADVRRLGKWCLKAADWMER